MGRKPKKTKPTVPNWTANASEPRKCHTLAGIEPDNVLAFLALLGTLRALETSRSDWHPRVLWDVHTHPWRPILTLKEPETQVAIAKATVEGVRNLVSAHAVTGDAENLNFKAEDFAALRKKADECGREVLDALSSEKAINENKGTLRPTPFAFMFGQGHQHFLVRFRDVPSGFLQGTKDNEDASLRHIATTLFIPWHRADSTDGFRWDPVEDRRYALCAADPSNDPTTTQHGANCLATVALPLLPVTPIRRRRGTGLLTPMTRFQNDAGIIEFNLPLWKTPAKLAGILALLRHPELAKDSPDLSVLPQVEALSRSTRIFVGKFFNLTPAKKIV